MKTCILLLALCFFLIAVIPRLLSLDAHWSSDEARWLRRSAQFMSAVKQGEFSETLIAHHPGVTTMWIAGLRTFFTDPKLDVLNLASARWFIGIIVSAGMSLACLLLYQLFGKWIALASFASLAFSPLFLAQTRRVHTDALATTFILLTVLLFLCYCQNPKHHRDLIFSGVTFGLALLSKSYALILLPWIPFCLFLFWKSNQKNSGFKRSILTCLCFLSSSLLTVILGWPVFWKPTFAVLAVCLFGGIYTLAEALKKETISVKSLPFLAASLVFSVTGFSVLQTVWTVLNKAGKAVITPHEVRHFFLEKAVNDPGWLFYPFVLTIKSTPLMLPLALVACLLLWKQRKDSEETARQFRLALAFVAGVVLFTVCLSATSKKFSRYLLPAFPMLEILAAIGFVTGLELGYTALCSHFGSKETAKYKTALATLAGVGFFVIQVLPVFARHPYYGTYYNLCWKVTDITNIITVGDASGLDLPYPTAGGIRNNVLVSKTPTAHGLSGCRDAPLFSHQAVCPDTRLSEKCHLSDTMAHRLVVISAPLPKLLYLSVRNPPEPFHRKTGLFSHRLHTVPSRKHHAVSARTDMGCPSTPGLKQTVWTEQNRSRRQPHFACRHRDGTRWTYCPISTLFKTETPDCTDSL